MAPQEERDDPLVSKASKGSQEALRIAEEAREEPLQRSSFGGSLFLGGFAQELLYPFPKQNESDRAEGDRFLAQLEKLLREKLDPDEVDRTYEIPQELIDGLAALGAFAMKVPKKFGGLGLSQTNYNRAVMMTASYCGSTATLLSAHQSIGVPQPLLMYGTEEQRQKYFPRFREGAISAFALTEVDVGSDPAQMSAQAVLSADGSHYILNGSKLWCTNGTIAELIVVTALTKPKMVKGRERKQISAFILEMNSPGVAVTHRCEFMGLHGIYNGVLTFKDVKIPKENLIDNEGRGLAIALGTVNVGRLTLPAATTGGAKQCLSIARRWSKERVQWGQPIGSHEAGQDKLAHIAATTLAMEAVTWLTSHWAESGKVDIRIEAAMAKLFTTEALWTITDLTMQLRGGRGYETARSLKGRGEEPFPVERAMRDCRINRILEGTSEIMRLFLAREALDPHLKILKSLLQGSLLKRAGAAFRAVGHYALWYGKLWFCAPCAKRYREMGALAPHYRFIERQSRRLARALFGKMIRYRQGLEKKQSLLARLMEIGTDLFVMGAVCSYARGLEEPSAVQLADHFCRGARRRVEANFAALKDNDDPLASEVAEELLKGTYRWLEKGIIPSGRER